MTTDRLPWGVLIPAVLAPNLFYATARGAVIPMIPLLAVHMGAGVAIAALIAALLMVGELVATLPASWLVVRIGEQASMIVGAALTMVGAACSMLAPDVIVLAVGVLLIGAAGSVYLVARQAWVAITVPGNQRGRAYSLVSGSQRIGLLIGPLLTALALSLANNPRYAFGVAVVAAAGAIAVLAKWPTPPERQFDAGEELEAAPGILQTMWRQRGVLMRLGGAAALLGSMRAVRQVIVPLWGADLGLTSVQITLVVAACSAIDVMLFYTGGQIIDRFGRQWVAVPTMIGFAFANIGLAVTSQLPGRVEVFIGMAVLMALSNAISSGLNATMGADLADPQHPAVYLGSWRLVNEIGPATVPLLLSAVTAAVSLPVAASVMGLISLGGAGAMWRYIRRYLPHEKQ